LTSLKMEVNPVLILFMAYYNPVGANYTCKASIMFSPCRLFIPVDGRTQFAPTKFHKLINFHHVFYVSVGVGALDDPKTKRFICAIALHISATNGASRRRPLRVYTYRIHFITHPPKEIRTHEFPFFIDKFYSPCYHMPINMIRRHNYA